MRDEANYRKVNFEVMTDTKRQYETNLTLKLMVKDTISKQYIVNHEDVVEVPTIDSADNVYSMTSARTLDVAESYVEEGMKVAVLNFANNHSIGGAPFSAFAQEESICRCSTLLPCLEAMKEDFYDKHRRQYEQGMINYMGNDDLIYTPQVCVFKREVKSPDGVIIPQMMDREEWFDIDVITCAAPELWHGNPMPEDYEEQLKSRVDKILSVAQKENVDVLVLGAWGCGAFKNPEEIVARVMHYCLNHYGFDAVVFAMGHDYSDSAFYKEFFSSATQEEQQIMGLLKSTGRENIDTLIKWMQENHFFSAPASVVHHNNVRGGLAKHSLDVFHEAMKLNKNAKLPINSVKLCALLHDICKADQYGFDDHYKPVSYKDKLEKGHGRRSLFIVKRKCMVPLNYSEEMAIWWHMGKYEPSLDRFQSEYNESTQDDLCKLIRQADYNVTHETASTASKEAAEAEEKRKRQAFCNALSNIQLLDPDF